MNKISVESKKFKNKSKKYLIQEKNIIINIKHGTTKKASQ